MKQCGKCSLVQDESEFVRDKRRKDGLYPYCKTCSKQYYQQQRSRFLEQKKEYANRPEIALRDKEQKRQWYKKNRDRVLLERGEYYKDVENRKKLILWKAKERASKEGLVFDLSLEDINIPTHCPYLKIELTHTLGKGQLPTNSSLDRIDSTKGYIPGNVQVISRLANTMKSNATKEELLMFAKSVLEIEGSNVYKYVEVIKQYV